MDRWTTTIIAIILVLTAFPILVPEASVGGSSGDAPSRAPTDHDPIRIDSNAEFASMASAEGWAGDGTEGDPYVIENFSIDGTDAGCCLYIGNVTDHFTIRNCTFANARYGPGHEISSNVKYYGENGITFWMVQNGTLEEVVCLENRGFGGWLYQDFGRIANSTFAGNNRSGLWISGSDSEVANCEFSNNTEQGLYVNSLYGGLITFNHLADNGEEGIVMNYMTKGNEMTDNTFERNGQFDMLFQSSEENVLRGNAMENGFDVISSERTTWETLDVDETNTLNGKPIRFYRGAMPATIDTGSPMIYFVNITGVEIDGFSPSAERGSANILFCDDVTISNSSFHGSFGKGLFIDYSNNVTVRNCDLFENGAGLVAECYNDVVIEGCSVYDNMGAGISVGISGKDDSLIVRDNEAYQNGGDGLGITQKSGQGVCSVTGNSVHDNLGGLGYSSSKGGGSDDVPLTDLIAGNSIMRNSDYGLMLSLSHSYYRTMIENNLIMGNGAGFTVADRSMGGSVIKNNTISENNGSGIRAVLSNHFVEFEGEDISCGIFGNTIDRNSEYGIFVVASSKRGVPIGGNTIRENGADGIALPTMSTGDGTRIRDNKIEKNGGVGISLTSQKNGYGNEIRNNSIRFNDGWEDEEGEWLPASERVGGIFFVSDSSGGYPIIDNSISDNNGTGIKIIKSSSGSGNISGNEIMNNSGDGINIYVSRAANRTIWRNSISGNKDSGIEFGPGIDGYEVRENTITENREGILLSRSNGTEIERNKFSLNGIGILSEWGDNATIDMNLFSDNPGFGVRIKNGNLSTIWNNSFFRNNGANETFSMDRRQACDNGTGNMWYFKTTGNYWDDWRDPATGENRTDPYPIACGAGSLDRYPLNDPPFGPFNAELRIDSPENGAIFNTSTVVIKYTLILNGAVVEELKGHVRGEEVDLTSGEWTIENLTEDNHVARIVLRVSGGLVIEALVSFRVDLTDPTVNIYEPLGHQYKAESNIVVHFSEEMDVNHTGIVFPIQGVITWPEMDYFIYDPTSEMAWDTQYDLSVYGRDLSGRRVVFNYTFSTVSQLFNITGRVIDEDGEPIEGVKVSIDSGMDLTLTTSVNGSFALSLGPGSYSYTLRRSGYEDRSQGFEVVDKDVDLGDIVIYPEEAEDDDDSYCLCGIPAAMVLLLLVTVGIFVVVKRSKKSPEE